MRRRVSHIMPTRYSDSGCFVTIQAGANMRAIMVDNALAIALATPPASANHFQFFVEFAMEILERHSEGKPRARVFAHALLACATDEQLPVWEGWIKASLSPELFAQIETVIRIPYGACGSTHCLPTLNRMFVCWALVSDGCSQHLSAAEVALLEWFASRSQFLRSCSLETVWHGAKG